MTEDDYIAATNLAAIRIASAIIRAQVFAHGPIGVDEAAAVARQLRDWRVALERQLFPEVE